MVADRGAHSEQPVKFMQHTVVVHIQQASQRRSGVLSPEASGTFWLLLRDLF